MEDVQGLPDVVCEVLGRIVNLQAEEEAPEVLESPISSLLSSIVSHCGFSSFCISELAILKHMICLWGP